jgi:hypothetical protein
MERRGLILVIIFMVMLGSSRAHSYLWHSAGGSTAFFASPLRRLSYGS